MKTESRISTSFWMGLLTIIIGASLLLWSLINYDVAPTFGLKSALGILFCLVGVYLIPSKKEYSKLTPDGLLLQKKI